MKTLEFTEEQIKMLKDACLVVVGVIATDNECDKSEAVKYKTLYNYLNS